MGASDATLSFKVSIIKFCKDPERVHLGAEMEGARERRSSTFLREVTATFFSAIFSRITRAMAWVDKARKRGGTKEIKRRVV
jgi:hypothetical protein